MTIDQQLTVDPRKLRSEVRTKYREVALNPQGDFHFHTGRQVAERLGYPADILSRLPDEAMASFVGVDNPFAPAPPPEGARVVDLGSGGGFDCLVAGSLVGPTGRVIGVDMTPEMLEQSRRLAAELGASNVEFREGILEELPVPDGWADVVISNGVPNLVADKPRVFAEARRILADGGWLQFADLAAGAEIPEAARCDIGLWTDCIAGSHSVDEWCDLISAAGFSDISVGQPMDTFGGAPGEPNARKFKVFGHVFRARAA